jgi:hypothetical protein
MPHKAAKLAPEDGKNLPKGGKLAAKVCTAHSNFFFLHSKIFVLYNKNI